MEYFHLTILTTPSDHALDPGLPVQNIAVGRGALIQSTKPTWLVGTAFEHSVLYQYNLHRASNVYIGLQQTENPYWQGAGTPERAPAPWTSVTVPPYPHPGVALCKPRLTRVIVSVNPAFGDPDFSNCAAQLASANDQCYRAWAVTSVNSSNIVTHGSAMVWQTHPVLACGSSWKRRRERLIYHVR